MGCITNTHLHLCVGMKASLTTLIAKLERCQPHFIRCIKPNNLQAPCMFDSAAVRRQLRYSGILETVRIRHEGFPIRLPFHVFLRQSVTTCSLYSRCHVCQTISLILLSHTDTGSYASLWHQRYIQTLPTASLSCRKLECDNGKWVKLRWNHVISGVQFTAGRGSLMV